MMTTFPNGTKVHVEFNGTVISEPWIGRMLKHSGMMNDDGAGEGGFVAIADECGIVHLMWHGNGADVFTAAGPDEPEFWPPLAGDLWTVNGAEYFVRYHRSQPSEVIVEAVDASTRPTQFWACELEDFKALNPVLNRRR